MLTLGVKHSERVRIKVGDVEIWVTLTDSRTGQARLSFDAPRGVEILREKLVIEREQDELERNM